jgi:hypothetical protein
MFNLFRLIQQNYKRLLQFQSAGTRVFSEACRHKGAIVAAFRFLKNIGGGRWR